MLKVEIEKKNSRDRYKNYIKTYKTQFSKQFNIIRYN